MNLYVKRVVVDSNKSVWQQLKGAMRGQHVFVNGMKARVANMVNGVAVLAMKNENGDLLLAQYK